MEHGASHYYGIINFSLFLLSMEVPVWCLPTSFWCIFIWFQGSSKPRRFTLLRSVEGWWAGKLNFAWHVFVAWTCKLLKVFFFPSSTVLGFCFLCYYFPTQWVRQTNLNLICKHEPRPFLNLFPAGETLKVLPSRRRFMRRATFRASPFVDITSIDYLASTTNGQI